MAIPHMDQLLPGFVRIDLLAVDAERALLERGDRPDTPAQVLYLAEQIEARASELAVQARVAARNAVGNGHGVRVVDEVERMLGQMREQMSQALQVPADRPVASLPDVTEAELEPPAVKKPSSKPKKKLRKRRFVEQEIPVDKLIELRQQGLTYTEIGERCGFSGATVAAYGKRVLPEELTGRLPSTPEEPEPAPSKPEREKVQADGKCLKCGQKSEAANPVYDNRCLICRLEQAGLADGYVYNSRELRIRLHDALAHASVDELKERFGRA